MRSEILRRIAASFALAALAASTFGQSTPFLTNEQIRMLRNEISGDRAYEHIRVLTQWHRDSGMEGYFKAMDYVSGEARKAGLSDVAIIPQPLSLNYTAVSAELWMTEPVEVKLADIGDHALLLSDNSRDADVEADLVWGGDGSNEALEGVDVKGKIVLVNGNPGAAVANAVYRRGAVGVIAYTTSEQKSMLDFPDQIPWTRIPDPPRGGAGSFAFNLPPRRGETLKKVLEDTGEQDYFATGIRTKGGKVRVRAKVDTKIGNENERTGTGMVEGWIRGTRYKDQQIVITAHLQEEQGSANDDGSGSANILELARVFNKLISEGKIPPPLRDIRFWWSDEISSEYHYIRTHPGSEMQMLVNLHQDMTGAKQSMGSRVQHLIFAPHSRTSYLDALFESIGDFVIKTNNAFITAGRQGGYPRPFSQPIIATRGSREAYNARFVPYFGSSDNLVFVEGAIGVPSVALINWDDYYIHSSDDDLGNIDQTQLQRNNFIVGAMAFYLAYAEAKDVPLLAAETYAQGSRRLANDLHVALMITEAREGFVDAKSQIVQGGAREERAIESMRVIAGDDERANRSIDKYLELNKSRTAQLIRELEEASGLRSEGDEDYLLSPPERAAKQKIPENIAPLDDYFSKRRGAPTGLHPVMRSEVFNFVDGKKSYLDIYHAVRAEARAAGQFLYGEVTLEDVVKLLDANVESGALKLK